MHYHFSTDEVRAIISLFCIAICSSGNCQHSDKVRAHWMDYGIDSELNCLKA